MSEQPYFTIYGEDWNYESNTNGAWVDRESFDALARRLQEAERALQLFVDLGITRGDWVELDEALSCASNILAGKGGKP